MEGFGLEISWVGIALVAILIVDVAVILRIMTSHAVLSAKLLWIALVLLLPVIGVVLWFVFGARQAERQMVER